MMKVMIKKLKDIRNVLSNEELCLTTIKDVDKTTKLYLNCNKGLKEKHMMYLLKNVTSLH